LVNFTCLGRFERATIPRGFVQIHAVEVPLLVGDRLLLLGRETWLLKLFSNSTTRRARNVTYLCNNWPAS